MNVTVQELSTEEARKRYFVYEVSFERHEVYGNVLN